MTSSITIGAELPDYTATWRDGNAAVIDFSTGYTFTLRLGIPGREADFEKTSGITGASTAPNITVAWTAAELDDLTPGTRVLEIWARSGGKDRGPFTDLLTLNAAVSAVA